MKKFVLALIVSLCLVVPVSVNASELEKSFETSFDFGTSIIYSMTSYDDSGNVDGYIVYNCDGFIKYDLNNKMILNKTDVRPDDLEVTENNSNLIIKRIDLNTGNILWQREYGGSGYEHLSGENKFIYSYNNFGNVDGYFIFFETNSLDLNIDPGLYIMKCSLNGDVIWIRKNKCDIYSEYTKNDGVWYNYFSYRESAGFYVTIKNLLNMTNIRNILSGSYFPPRIILDKHTNSNLIILSYSYNEPIKFKKYTLFGDNIILSKDLSVDNSNRFVNSIDSKSILGEYDGFIVVTNSGDLGNAVLKFDYEGNLIWKGLLSHNASGIYESYDETGEFNGYIVTGYDIANKKGYITKFTYPKRNIVSEKNEIDVPSASYPGKTVTVKAKEKTGYVVKKIIVKDISGEEIEVSDDGTFVMPDDDVSIEVVYEKKAENIIINPDTASTLSIVLIIISIVIIGSVMVRNRKHLER